MLLLRQVPANTLFGMLLFAAVAFLSMLENSESITRILVRAFIEFPLMLVFSTIIMLVINLLAAVCGTLLGGPYFAALIAAVLGWAVSGDSPFSFSGPGSFTLLQPAFAIGCAARWLIQSTSGPN